MDDPKVGGVAPLGDGPGGDWGEREALFRPSRGQTTVGVSLAAAFSAAAFAVAVLGCGFDTSNRACAAAFGVGWAGVTVWIWRRRAWRLEIYPGGLVQVGPRGREGVAWSEVTEVVEKRHNGWCMRVTLCGAGRDLVVNPINLRARDRMFRVLLDTVARRVIPIRVDSYED